MISDSAEQSYVVGIVLFSISPSVIPIVGGALSRLGNGLT